MSSGSFVTATYVATYNTSQRHPIRVQPETLQLSVNIGGSAVENSSPTTSPNNPISAVVSRGRRSRGLNARLIRVKFGVDAPEGYLSNSTITLPAVNAALLAAPEGALGTYLGKEIQVVGTSAEEVR